MIVPPTVLARNDAEHIFVAFFKKGPVESPSQLLKNVRFVFFRICVHWPLSFLTFVVMQVWLLELRIWKYFDGANDKLLSMMSDSCPTNFSVISAIIAARPDQTPTVAATLICFSASSESLFFCLALGLLIYELLASDFI